MAISALRWFKAALVLQVLLLAYVVAMETLDLFPWNDLAARPPDYELGKVVALSTLPLLACLGLFAVGLRVLALVSVVGYAAWLGWELWRWWPKYIFGADPAWENTYGTDFARTLKLLPTSGTHLPPDAQHLALQLLLIAVVATAAIAAARMRYL